MFVTVLISIYFSDINECTTNNGGCHWKADCTNTVGSRTCKCQSGYTGNGFSCSGKYQLTIQSKQVYRRIWDYYNKLQTL